MHDIGFTAFLVIAVCQSVSALCGAWLAHKRIGMMGRSVVFPVVIVSGVALCWGVRPADDWVVFASYGASWSLMCVQMVSGRIIGWLHGASVLHNVWVLWYLWEKWGSRDRDLFVILSILPWMHLNWIFEGVRWTARRMHMATGIDIIYMGLLGTVFSFTHEPYLDNGAAVWTVFVVMHLGYVSTRIGLLRRIGGLAHRT